MPVALAVSDSPLVRSLLRENRLVVEYVETGGPHTISTVAEFPNQRWLLHNSVWNWSLAHPRALEQQGVLAVIRDTLEQTQAPWLSVHLGFSADQVTFKDGMQPTSAPLERAALISRLIRSVSTLKQALSVPLLLENLDYNATGAYEHICEPEVITAVLKATDTYLLLDLAHAQVSAARLGHALNNYLERLPLERVRQLHISSPRLDRGILRDVHEALRSSDYQVLEDMLVATTPWALTLEYQRNANALQAQLEQLRTIVENLKR